jgi:uncharacterized protein (TIGR03437 family)
LCASGVALAQLSPSAYRVLGQPDLHQQGTNIVQGVSLYNPFGAALDPRGGQIHLYISDTHNFRVLAWHDTQSYQSGDPPDLILAQPGPYYSNPLGIGTQGLNTAGGLAVDPRTGNLYVADFGNNRVLRFASPFANPSRIQPDAVYGQPDFKSLAANTGGISPSSMSQPRAVAFDSGGNLWVADSGNHRVLRFAAGSLNNTTPPAADTVLGQKDFLSNPANRGGAVSGSGFNNPSGITLDGLDNLYVSDLNNNRVLKFNAPLGPSSINAAAAAVFGQPDFVSRTLPAQPSASTLNGPAGLAVDSSGRVFVAVPGDNRVLVFPPAGGAALNVLGQSDFVTVTPNTGAYPQASSNTLFSPFDVRVDSAGNLYVSDTKNNRVLEFPPNSKSAVQIWGQTDFASNGANQVKPASLNVPFKVAIDYSKSPFALYASDTANNRVLVWKDAVNFRSGDSADLAIGQPNLRTGIANIDTQGSANPSSTSLNQPTGLAVDSSGDLWVADSGNNRVLRYPRPVEQAGRVTPDIVFGQADFNSSASAAVNGQSLHTPAELAVGPDGSVFVADSGNNRVLQFPAGAGSGAAAVRVFGQPAFTTSLLPATPSAQTLSAPLGLAVDPGSNLYVADTAANRVVIIPNTQVAATTGTPAAFVIGQDSFNTSAGSASGTRFKGPADVTLDSNGNIYVSDNGNNRVLGFSSLIFLPVAGGTASGVIGQKDLGGSAANWNSTDGLATPEGLSGPLGLYMDRRDTLYVADSNNNRVVHYLKPASVVNAAHYLTGVPVGQGGLAALKSFGLSDTSAPPATDTPWLTALANRQVVFNDTIVSPLYAVVPSQINFQVPSGVPVGSDRVAVRTADTGELIAGGTVLVAVSSPGLFTISQDGTGQAAARNQDGVTVNGASNPAPRGSVISLYGTGQGQVSPAVADGFGAPANPPASTVAVPTSDGKACLATQPSVCVNLGNGFGNIQFSGLAPNFVGLWQINVQIPLDAATGNAVPLRVIINGTPSNTVTVAIR